MASEIICRKLLLVEGIDEICFLSTLMNVRCGWMLCDDKQIKYKLANSKDTIIMDKPNNERIQIVSVGGKTKFRSEFSTFIKRPSFTNVTDIAFIRDADVSYASAFASIVDILRENHKPYPNQPCVYTTSVPRTGIYIMPNNSSNGMLETLCLQSVNNSSFMDCINNYIDCITKKNEGSVYNQIDKRKCLVFLSAMPEVDSRVGIASQKGYWDLNNSCFDSLIEFLQNL